MVRKETAPFDNPWLSAIDSTEQKLTRYASSHSAPETPRSIWLDHRPLTVIAEQKPARSNGWLAANRRPSGADTTTAPTVEEYQQLLPTLTRISQRLQAQEPRSAPLGGQDESVEVALRVVRKQRAGRLK